MMPVLGALLALGTIWLAGALLLGLLAARDTRSAAGIAADFAAGATLLGLAGTLSVVLGARLSWYTLYVPLALLAVAAVFRRPRLRVGIAPPADAAARVLLLLALAALAVLAAGALGDRLWWDGWATWAFKARVLFLDGTLPPLLFDPAGPYTTTNLHYPLAVPLLGWWAYLHAGAADPALASLVGAAWLALLVLLVWGALSGTGVPRLAAAATLGVAVFWPVSSYALGGTADVVVALVLLGATLELRRALTRDDAAPLVRLAAYLSLGVLAKGEGLAIVLMVAGVGVPAMWWMGRGASRMLAAAAVPLLVYAPWHLFTTGRGLASAAVTTRTSVPWQERAAVLGLMTDQLLAAPVWTPVALLAAIGLVLAVARRDTAVLCGWAVMLAYLAAVVAVYLRADADIVWLVATGYERVMAATVPTAIVLSLAAAGTGDGSDILPCSYADPAPRS